MDNKKYSVEELMLDEGYLDFCLHEDSAYRPYWERIIELNPNQKTFFEKAAANIRMLSGSLSEKEILLQVEKVRRELRTPKAGNKYATTLHEKQLIDDVIEMENTKPFKGFIFYSAAAFALLCVGLYFLSPSLTKTSSQTTKVVMITYNSKPGERRTVQLPDGSTVLLNGNSEISIKNDFNKTKREVNLKGEAFFTVAKNAVKPFIVESDNFYATAIGTAFYVHARDAEEYRVDLLEGKVKLSADTYSMFLMPGEEGRWDTSETNFNKINFDTLQLKQWITGKISFDKTPIHQAIEELKNWYAVDIEIANKELEKKTVSGDYNNASLDNILKVLCFTLSCKYHYENNKVIIE